MAGRETITHEGIVKRTSGNGSADIEIIAASACSGCHARSACSAANTETKIVTVRSCHGLKPGDRVTVVMKQSQGFTALVLGYIIPFVVLITAFTLLSVWGAGELISALGSFAAVALYYGIIWFLRSRIDEKFEFKIKS